MSQFTMQAWRSFALSNTLLLTRPWKWYFTGVLGQSWKIETLSSFCLLPMHPGDFELLGFSFEGQFYVHRTLAIACSVSCIAFKKFRWFLEWPLWTSTRFSRSAHYLDKCLFVGRWDTRKHAFLLQKFMQLAEDLGVPLEHEKMEMPKSVLSFLGNEADSWSDFLFGVCVMLW